jgi:acetyl esterase/lipase
VHVVDPEVAAGLEDIFGTEAAPPPPIGDWRTRRDNNRVLFEGLWQRHEPPQDVDVRDIRIPAQDGTPLSVRLYRTPGTDSRGVLLYLHGGGMFMGSLETHDGVCRTYASVTGLPVMAVDYRLAPEYPFPAPVDDCYAALIWLASSAAEHGLDPSNIVVAGESAGGGLAAAVALKARDEQGPAIAGQMLVCPMLDDRTVTADADLDAVAVWSYGDHVTAWGAYLGPDPVESAYATPLRATDLSGLPPTYLEVGELDIFRIEDLAYTRRLLDAGVPVEFHLHPGVPHAFDLFAPHAQVSQRAMADRRRFLARVTESGRDGK